MENEYRLYYSLWAPGKRFKRKKVLFWQFLDEEAQRAKNQGKGFILQGDLNAWLGPEIISKDPRKQNEMENLWQFLKENNLTVVNSMDL